MLAAASRTLPWTARRNGRRGQRPSFRRAVAFTVAVAGLLAISTVASTIAYLRLPPVTGSHAVGRMESLLTDPARMDRHVQAAHRQVRLLAWYPAVPGTGTSTGYVPGLEKIAAGLEASGELSAAQVAGLGFVQDAARDGASLVTSSEKIPVVLLSPGNATNVAFYASLAEDLASHGYVVIGLDHPYQVAAVDLGAGATAVYPGDPEGAPGADLSAKIDERVADLAFVLDRLPVDAAGLTVLGNRLDLSRVAIVGHSNGGIAAAEACNAGLPVAACVNIDGQAAGGPFAADPNPDAPPKPFMFLTKETELHPSLGALFERAGPDTYRVVVPAARHGDFADGARFNPRALPLDGTSDAVLAIERGFVRAFLDHELRGEPESVFGTVAAPIDVQVSVYPLIASPAPRPRT